MTNIVFTSGRIGMIHTQKHKVSILKCEKSQNKINKLTITKYNNNLTLIIVYFYSVVGNDFPRYFKYKIR